MAQRYGGGGGVEEEEESGCERGMSPSFLHAFADE